MTSSRDPDRLIRAFLQEGLTELPNRVYDAVRADIDRTRRRADFGSWRTPNLNTFARLGIAAAAVVGVGIVGINLLPADGGIGGGTDRSPSPTLTESPSLSVTTTPSPVPDWQRAGFIGLPPSGAAPSRPQVGELVDEYPVHGGGMPFEGAVRLYADGRLIWYMFYDGPEGENSRSTGYLEQRLTPEGVELVRDHIDLDEKDPLRLQEWLPASAWEDRQITAWVPWEYAICFTPGGGGPYPRPGPPLPRSPLWDVLPASAQEILRDRETVPPIDDRWDCVALPTEDARDLNQSLSTAGLERIQPTFVLAYQLDTPGLVPNSVWIYFEPRYPDGTAGCSGCG